MQELWKGHAGLSPALGIRAGLPLCMQVLALCLNRGPLAAAAAQGVSLWMFYGMAGLPLAPCAGGCRGVCVSLPWGRADSTGHDLGRMQCVHTMIITA